MEVNDTLNSSETALTYPSDLDYSAYLAHAHCYHSQANATEILHRNSDADQLFCNATHDTVTCWPTTAAGTFAVLKCPEEHEGAILFPGNISKYCYQNGTWKELANYSACFQEQPVDEDWIHQRIVVIIFLVGYSTSTLALIVALCIFLHFRALRCLRNIIHCHLMVSFVLKNTFWILLHIVLPYLSIESHNVHEIMCKVSIVVLNYMLVSNFFWMLVEGIYLLTMVVWAYSQDKVKRWYLIVIGWGLPAVITTAWALVRNYHENTSCWLPTSNYYDYVYIGPILLVLLINAVILGVIMYILITKLRATNCSHTRQSRKAVRATLILFPLLGGTYLLVLMPFTGNEIEKHIFRYVNVVLQSFQGLAVAVFYCFLNGEVKSVLRGRFSQWQDERSVATRYTRASIMSSDDTRMFRKGSQSVVENDTGIAMKSMAQPYRDEEI